MGHNCACHEENDCCGQEGCGGGACSCGEGCGGDCHCGGGCKCHGHHFQRRYQTKAEQIAELEAYLDEVKKELQAVEEMLADLRK